MLIAVAHELAALRAVAKAAEKVLARTCAANPHGSAALDELAAALRQRGS
jgi:hypothetical protein